MARAVLRRSVVMQRLYRAYRRREQQRYYPDWRSILADGAALWRDALERARTGPGVLLATSMGGLPTAVIMDSFLAVALTLRGANVRLLLCDSSLPACLMAEIGLFRPAALAGHGPQRYLCHQCQPIGESVYGPLGLPVHRYGDLLTDEERQLAVTATASTPVRELLNLEVDGIPLGEHIGAGALRYFARADLEGEANAEAVVRRYAVASVQTLRAVRRLLGAERIEVVSCINGIYVPQGVVAAVARAEQRRVVTWSVAYRKKSFIFSHGDTYHHTLMSEPTSAWESMEWTEAQEQEIVEYLRTRRRGGRDWIVFHSRKADENLNGLGGELRGFDPSRPSIGLLTNVAWDAQLHYPANAFPNMLDWLTKTVAYFAGRPDLQLVIRVHPAEVSGDIPSRQPVVNHLRSEFPRMPRNVFVVPPSSRMSTYALMERCDSVIIYGTKTGVELTSLGVPVIVAGEAWIRNKGVTMDVSSAEEYCRLLDRLPCGARLGPEVVKRAQRYAYHFFFRRMIPLGHMVPTGSEPQFQVRLSRLEDLLPGWDPGLDVICDGILNGTDFVYPAERLGRPRED